MNYTKDSKKIIARTIPIKDKCRMLKIYTHSILEITEQPSTTVYDIRELLFNLLEGLD